MKNKLKKKILLFSLILFISCFFITGCGDKDELTDRDRVVNNKSILDEIDINGSGKLSCTRVGFATGVDVDLRYELEYKDGNVLLLHSMEKVISDDNDKLDEYETAYRNIAKNYKGLKYYDINIIRDKDSVLNDTVINYEKIDTKKLLDIEGEEDNIIVDGVVALKDWVGFAEKFGTVCEKVE